MFVSSLRRRARGLGRNRRIIRRRRRGRAPLGIRKIRKSAAQDVVRAGVRVGRALVRVRALIKMKTRPRFGSGKEGWWWWREEAENSKTSRLASSTLVPFPRETIIITCVYTRFRRFVFVSRTAPHRHTIACNNTTVTRISYGVQKKYLPPPPSRRNFVRSGSTLSINEK